MLKASIGLNNLHILLPMVTSVSEVEEALYLLERDWIAVQEEEQVKITKPKIGIMVEVPSVLLQIGEFAELVDFFSVGSNDLIQYLLAVDRNNPRVSSVYSHFHPSILRALTRLVQECHKYDKPISICGEMAGDPLSAILLMAMGFNTLSMSSSNILRVRKAICHVSMSDAEKLLEEVVAMNNPLMVKSWMEYYFKHHGLADMGHKLKLENNVLNQKKLSSVLLLLVLPTFGLMGCSKPEKAEVITTESSASSVASETVKTESIQNTFDLSQIPISNITLGQFPYISLPNGYQFHDATKVNFEKIPFWTGQHIQNIEGQLYSAAIQQNEDYKEGSFLELQRNLENVIQQLGGKQITMSKIPQQALDKLPQKFQVDYVAGLGDVFNNPTQTFVVRQANKNIWFQLTQTGNGNAGLLVAETKPVEITAKVLNSDQLKTALDKENKVNIEVNFATDQANILPESQTQIEQVIQLLKNNPELKLTINGHTDGSGDAKHNQALSEQRANAVVKALTDNTGIQQNRLTAKGFGDTQPVAENSTENGKALNRRVELIKSH
ncbi:hypothetical protein FQR65_LT15862 [Abscondita terminalis]|nr:hypothetical protein FQR65_LT15862 [Abscondita terminalis]